MQLGEERLNLFLTEQGDVKVNEQHEIFWKGLKIKWYRCNDLFPLSSPLPKLYTCAWVRNLMMSNISGISTDFLLIIWIYFISVLAFSYGGYTQLRIKPQSHVCDPIINSLERYRHGKKNRASF